MEKPFVTYFEVQLELDRSLDASIASRTAETSMDEFCTSLTDRLSSSDGQPSWKPGVILTLKQALEKEPYYHATRGPDHPGVLSTPTLILILKKLLCTTFFNHVDAHTGRKVELHFRCILASLRLLYVHGIQRGTGAIDAALHDQLNKSCTQWQQYLDGYHVGVRDSLKSYNNEFLIVLIQNMISDLPNNRTTAANLATRLVAAASFAGHAYSKNVVEALRALKIVVDVKNKPIGWLSQYRNMDDLCLSVRMLREYYTKNKDQEKWDESFHRKLVETELDVIKQLIWILDEEADNGFPNEIIRNAISSTVKAVGQSPISRANHLMYAILDLIQQHTGTIGSDDQSIKVINHILETAVSLARESRYSYLRCKAFEVLATLKSRLGDLPDARVRHEMSGYDADPQTVLDQWATVQEQTERMQKFLYGLRGDVQELASEVSIAKVPRPRRRVVEEVKAGGAHLDAILQTILTEVSAFEEHMICPVAKEQVPDLAKLKCGHSVSATAWKQLLETDSRCPVCRKNTERGGIWPVDEINATFKDVKENVVWVQSLVPWDADMTRSRPHARDSSHHPHPVVHRSGLSTPTGSSETWLPLPRSPSITSAKSRRDSLISQPESLRWEIKTDPPISLHPGPQPFRDVALSPTCHTLALVKPESFSIVSISQDLTKQFSKDKFSVTCIGSNDGRYGRPDGPLRKGNSCKMSYMMGALSDERLCMICHTDRNHLAVFDARTGQLIRSTKLSHPCYKINMSPNGGLLALALESGELYIYTLGSNRNFDSTPISVIKKKKQAGQQWLVKCMSISPDSEYICVCSDDDIIRTYHLDTETKKADLVSTYDPELSYPEKNHGICNLTFDPSSSRVLVVADAPKTPPFVLKFSATKKSFEVKKLRSNKSSDDYGDTNCCVAYSPLTVALAVDRKGMVKVMNCAMANRNWHVNTLEMEGLSGEGEAWGICKVGFNENGKIGFAIDRMGKVLVVRLLEIDTTEYSRGD